MSTRRTFIATAAVAAAAGASSIARTPAAAKEKAPSAFALAYAKYVQRAMPRAHLSDALIEKIAGDIDSYEPTAANFRKGSLRNWDEPDFTFLAGPPERAR